MNINEKRVRYNADTLQKRSIGVVALVEVLNVQNIWTSSDIKEFHKARLDIIKECRDSSLINVNAFVRAEHNGCRIEPFGDKAIVLFIEGVNPPQLIPMMAGVLSEPFFQSLCRGIYLRGTISIGNFSFTTDRTLIGPAIDEAMEW